MAARRPLVLVDGQIRQMTVDEFNDLRWQMLPLGMRFPIDTHTTGVPVPPTDNPNYRYIKLTASDSYNDGVLTSESISGSAPHVMATAVISDAGSPLNGQTVQLVNTGRWLVRPGQSGVVELDALQDISGSFGLNPATGMVVGAGAVNGVFSIGQQRANRPTPTTASGYDVVFNASLVARTDTSTHDRSVGADYYMRIR